jgi:lipoprotein-anchoring transpeptidase ErfK/SrfK
MNAKIVKGLVGAALVLAVLSLAVPSAFAVQTAPKPLEIRKFTMQTTHTMKVPQSVGAISGFVNEPYSFTQAGGHPQALTTTIEFASEEYKVIDPKKREESIAHYPTRDPRDIVVDLPRGLLADPQAVPRCPLSQILDKDVPCPASTQVGVVVLHLLANKELIGPIVNLTPEAGQSAEFGLENDSGFTYVVTGHVVRTGSTYGLTAVTNSIPMTEVVGAELTFWGVPADPSHDPQRGLFCGRSAAAYSCHGGGEPSSLHAVPFWTMPIDCSGGPEKTALRADSWEEPGAYDEAEATFPAVTGCNLLQFNPAIEVLPDTLAADEPAGLGVNLKVPQVESTEAPATPQLRDSVVTLPEGVSVSPGIVDGIQACDESGPQGINFEGPLSEETGPNGELRLAPGHCPDASIVGTAEAETPLLPVPVKGHVYLARPGCGGPGLSPCTEQDALDGNLYQLYLELGGTGALADTGVNLKVRGKVEANPATGQLTTVFENTPQLPFGELRIRLNGGPRSPLDNPAVCGRATTTSDFTPWSAPGTIKEEGGPNNGVFMPGTPDATPSSFFNVDLIGDGLATSCPTLPLTPGFVAGTVTPQAGQFSAFILNLSRKDREQYVKGIQVHTPPGLLGMLSSVPLCGEPEADNGHCPEASRIGTTRVASGAGSHPFEIEGNVYLTGPYGGDPFGLSIVTHAVAGPFNLGLVVVRARIAVDPENSTLTITTDETGPYVVPQIIFGVPLRLQRVTVNIDRPGFMFNPTSCNGQQITAVISGSQNAMATVSSPFAVGGCKSLAFKPTFKVSTSGKTSRAKGASLDAKLSYPKGALGNDANIARVKVSLPKQLPSRLTTLQKACPAATFNANPAGCPPASIVGIARATTPLLPVGLSGPVYFVSHGGEAFPSLIVVLQGDGVRVDLVGSTFISKAGITSSTFKTVPDVPVNTFELYLPEGKFSALAANGNLCKAASKLVMPTEFLAQNGATLKQSTKIQVTGCKGRHARSPRRRTTASRRGGRLTRTRRSGIGQEEANK